MRRAAILVSALAVLVAPAAHASPPVVTAQASPASGAAPLTVTLTATGDAASYHWDLGDGSSADGPVVQHVYPAGRFVARVTATAPSGETAQAQVTVTSLGLALKGPRVGSYAQRVPFRGRLVPGLKGARVTLYRGTQRVGSAKTAKGGRFVIRARVGAPDAQYTAQYGGAVSNAVSLAVRPQLQVAFSGSGQVGSRLVLVARERPAVAGKLTVRVWRNGRLVVARSGGSRVRVRLSTRRPVAYRVLALVTPAQGYRANRRLVERTVFVPNLRVGSVGPSVFGLEQRLHELHYALGAVNGYFGSDTFDSVIAFQKLHGLPRTGAVDARFWRELESAHVPVALHRGAGKHVEVSKERQVLLLVSGGGVQLVVPVSTGATGNTPVGLWHVYSKVPGYNAKQMYYSSFFIGGFAIHGYHDVPPYPASHGCVRIPIWVAHRVYSSIDYGEAVYVY